MSRRTKRAVVWLSATALALALFLLRASSAEAHARYGRSEPGAGAIVSEAPTQVDIWFTQELFRREAENSISVFGPAGEAVHQGGARIDDDFRNHMWVELQSPMAPGIYRVEWRSLSAEDGDSDQGEFNFLYDPQAEVTSTPMLSETATSIPSATRTPSRSAPTLTKSPAPNEEEGSCALGLIAPLALIPLGFGLRKTGGRKP